MMRSQTCSISFSSWLTTRNPIFRSFTSASRKFQIWLWVMGSNMVLISSAIRNRVLSPRALAMQNRCSSPPESSPGYRFQSGIHSPFRMLPDHLHRAVTAPRKRHVVHTDTSRRRCAVACQDLTERRLTKAARRGNPQPVGTPQFQTHIRQHLSAAPRIFIADMFRFQSHRTFPPLPLIVLYEFSVYNMHRTLPPRTQTTGISPSHASRRSAQRGANGHPAGRSLT